jgi:hypothetical protein
MTQAPIQSTLTLSCSLPPSELSLDGWVAFWADAQLFRQFPALACTAAQGCCGLYSLLSDLEGSISYVFVCG